VPGKRGRLVLWDDTWVRYHEPGIGRAAVAVLEAAGYEVVLAEGRRCCGRPAASRGLLDEARRLGEHNVALLRELADGAPIVFLEPSCYSMFVDEYRELGIPGAGEVAARCVLFEELVAGLLGAGTRPGDGLQWRSTATATPRPSATPACCLDSRSGSRALAPSSSPPAAAGWPGPSA
jgi:Fe-S oxidoreductase